MKVRLQKFIADCGVTSRRKAEELILQGRVQVNGEYISELGVKVDTAFDTVSVDGELLDLQAVNKMYIVMNKPRSYMTTLNDPEGRRTVMDLIKEVSERVYPVGRLDYLSEGLLIMTNDGDLANKIMHPKYDINKVYEVKVFGAITDTILKKLRNGVQLEEGFAKPKSVRVIEQLANKTWLEFRLNEGRNREIRRICEAAGLTVDKLKRVAIEGLSIDGIAPGKYHFFSKKELLAKMGMNEKGEKNNKSKTPEYVSNKKSINLRTKGFQAATPADDRNFRMFRKDSYFDSVKNLDQKRRDDVEKAKQELYDAKEAAHKARKRKKAFREAKKELNQDSGVHAKFVK